MSTTSLEPTHVWNRNFVLLWQGQFISTLGKQAFSLIALLWMKDATGSGTLSGLIGALAMLPVVVLGPIAGVFVDRVNRGKMIAWTDIAGGILVLAAALAFLFIPQNPQTLPFLIVAVFVVAVGTGLLDTFSQPSITATIPDMVPKDKLEAANGFNMMGIQGAFLVAQGLAGILYRIVGAPLLILWNALTYLWAGITELWISTPDLPVKVRDANVHPFVHFREELAEGLRYVWEHKGLRVSLLLFTAMNLLVSPLLALMAFLVQDHMGLEAQWLGYLMACFGVGGIAGYIVAGVTPVKGISRLVAVSLASILQAIAVVMALIFTTWWAEILIFVLAGVTGGFANVHTMTLLQKAAPTELQGRVQSVSSTMATAVMPLGMVLAGIAWDLSGGDVWLVIGYPAILMLVLTILAAASKHYRAFFAGEGREAAP